MPTPEIPTIEKIKFESVQHKTDTHAIFDGFVFCAPVTDEYFVKYKCKACGFIVEGKKKYHKGDSFRCDVCQRVLSPDFKSHVLIER